MHVVLCFSITAYTGIDAMVHAIGKAWSKIAIVSPNFDYIGCGQLLALYCITVMPVVSF